MSPHPGDSYPEQPEDLVAQQCLEQVAQVAREVRPDSDGLCGPPTCPTRGWMPYGFQATVSTASSPRGLAPFDPVDF